MRRLTFWAILSTLLLWSFDRMMELDGARLCSSDATAYEEC